MPVIILSGFVIGMTAAIVRNWIGVDELRSTTNSTNENLQQLASEYIDMKIENEKNHKLQDDDILKIKADALLAELDMRVILTKPISITIFNNVKILQ